MYDPTFGPTSLGCQFRKSDFKHLNKKIRNDIWKEKQIQLACNLAKAGFSNLNLLYQNISRRKVYTLDDFPAELVLRKASENIKKISKVKQSDRFEIVRRIKLFCEEGLPFSVAKFDIKDFYKSIPHNELKDLILKRLYTSHGTRLVLDSFIKRCSELGIGGVPQGLSISAGLSELYMDDFDNVIHERADIFFYARYVDDIIIFLEPSIDSEDLKISMNKIIPKGLSFNSKKTKFIKFDEPKKCNPKKFDYLGFSFTVVSRTQNTKHHMRDVSLDIALAKVKKQKSRIVMSLRQFVKDKNFCDLRSRFRLIICGYKFYDKNKNRKRSAGICHTYCLIDKDASALKKLDTFKTKLVLLHNASLTQVQRQGLLKLSFKNAFQKKTHFNFSHNKLANLKKCWKYV